MNTAAYWIDRLNLQRHPEGGWFRETYRAVEQIGEKGLPARYLSPRCFSTAIYYLLEKNDHSVFHRLKSDETWHFYTGTSSIRLFIISPKGKLSGYLIGPHPDQDEVFQLHIPQNHWFAALLTNPEGFALIGCTVAPGFEFDDFEIGKRSELTKMFPKHREIIEKMTKAE
ncbi:MAG: cupin domain-containing protein [Prolixibacteraceae bacterium]|jgi:predicted cupin superfamily sugar epimerase|nr:cupin domain-containing protein [Prolixibacteraceae bacterium]